VGKETVTASCSQAHFDFGLGFASPKWFLAVSYWLLALSRTAR
jgi:hypothetical protein